MLSTSLNGAAISCTQVERGTALLRNNLGYHVGDDPTSVSVERQRCAERVGAPIIWMNQTHSTHVEVLNVDDTSTELDVKWGSGHLDPRQIGPQQHVEADGIFFDSRLIRSEKPALAVMTADCLPVVFSDETGQVVAAVHAGRVGLENGILLRTLERFAAVGVHASAVSAFIGPAICGRCYEVPEDMVQRLEKILSGIRSRTMWGTPALDLPQAAYEQLLTAGIATVELSEVCTFEDDSYHSYRRHSGSGRQATIVRPV